MIYFDNNASAPLTPSVAEALGRYIQCRCGNPSSEHEIGRGARREIEDARGAIARILSADPQGVVFTSGATEANSLALYSVKADGHGSRIVSTAVEHPSVLRSLDALERAGFQISFAPVDRDGVVRMEVLAEELSRPTALASVQWVNNETGVIQPIEAIAGLCRERGVRLHVDGAQALGRIRIDLSKLPIDYLSLSGHKFHAPAGIGALVVREGVPVVPLLVGGDQERGRRAGTENIMGIVGFGQAARDRERCLFEVVRHCTALRDRFERLLKSHFPWVEVVGAKANRVCNTSNIFFRGIDGQALVVQLGQIGVACSQASACHSRRPEPSYVLRAMGYPESEAYSCVRFSFSELNTMSEVDDAVEIIRASVEQANLFAWG